MISALSVWLVVVANLVRSGAPHGATTAANRYTETPTNQKTD